MGTPFQSHCRFLSPLFSPESSERNALNNKNTRIACKCQPAWARRIFNEIFFWLGAAGGGWWAYSLAVVAENTDMCSSSSSSLHGPVNLKNTSYSFLSNLMFPADSCRGPAVILYISSIHYTSDQRKCVAADRVALRTCFLTVQRTYVAVLFYFLSRQMFHMQSEEMFGGGGGSSSSSRPA